MSMSGGQTQTQNSQPWRQSIPYLTDIMSRADTLSQNTGLFTPAYSGATYAAANGLGALGQTPSFGAGQIQNAVGQTGAGLGTGLGALGQTANGSMLGGNPYLDAVLGKSMQDAAAGVNAQFSAAGRYGSGAHAGALARELGGIETNARMQDYTQERQNQLAAANSLGTLGMQGAGMAGQADQLAAQQLGYGLTGGSQLDQMALAQQQAPLNALNYAANITTPIGRGGGTSTTSSSSTPSIGSMIGGGLMMALASGV